MIVFLLNSNVVTDHVDNLKNVFIFDFSHSISFGQQQQPKKKNFYMSHTADTGRWREEQSSDRQSAAGGEADLCVRNKTIFARW